MGGSSGRQKAPLRGRATSRQNSGYTSMACSRSCHPQWTLTLEERDHITKSDRGLAVLLGVVLGVNWSVVFGNRGDPGGKRGDRGHGLPHYPRLNV